MYGFSVGSKKRLISVDWIIHSIQIKNRRVQISGDFFLTNPGDATDYLVAVHSGNLPVRNVTREGWIKQNSLTQLIKSLHQNSRSRILANGHLVSVGEREYGIGPIGPNPDIILGGMLGHEYESSTIFKIGPI